MVMGRKEVAVDFITRLKDKGFKDLEKNSKKSVKSLQKLGKVFGLTFSAVALTAFVKKSAQQFGELEKNSRRLESELGQLGLSFATSLATDFTRSLALSSGVSQDKLIPALQKLIQTTYTLTDAQKLLTLSTEISKRKGLELEQVSNALSRAFVGDYKALVNLRIGFEKAEVKGKNFQEILSQLQTEFGSKQADTFADKINKLAVAFEETQVAIGKGFVEGLEKSGLNIEDVQEKMIALGQTIGKALGKAVGFIDKVGDKLNSLAKNPAILAIFDFLDRLMGIDYGAAGRAADAETNARVKAANAYAKQLETQGKLVKLAQIEANLAKQRAAEIARLKREEAKREAEKQRNAAIEKLRNAINLKFDIDAINQQAALRRNLSETDKDRVLQLAALKISEYQTEEEAIKTLIAATTARYDEAMNLEMVLQQLKIAGFAQDKKALEELTALKPKITFLDNLDELNEELRRILGQKYTVNIDAATAAKSTITFTENLDDIAAKLRAITDKKYVIKIDADLPTDLTGGIPSNFDPASFRFFDEFTKSLQGLFGGGGGIPSNFDPARFRMGDNINITINNAGSVISQNELISTITDAVYQIQRYGNNLLLPNS